MQIGLENFLGFSEVYIFFEDANSIWWLRFLKAGFRHCFVLLVSREQKVAVLLNPRSNQLDVQIFHNCDSDNIIKSYSLVDTRTTVRVHISQAPLKCAPLMFFTCVEFVKRLVGIHSFSIITPYQLYKKIKNSRKKVLTS